MRRRQPKGVNFQDTAIVLSCFLILAFLSLFSYCFYFVYTEGYLANIKYLQYDQNPAATITKSLNLNKTFLGRFHLTRYLSLACVQLISGTFLWGKIIEIIWATATSDGLGKIKADIGWAWWQGLAELSNVILQQYNDRLPIVLRILWMSWANWTIFTTRWQAWNWSRASWRKYEMVWYCLQLV